jgi:hypothetical protein
MKVPDHCSPEMLAEAAALALKMPRKTCGRVLAATNRYDRMYVTLRWRYDESEQSNSSQGNQHRPLFLHLPPELRNQIYQLAIGHHVICIYPPWCIKNKQG